MALFNKQLEYAPHVVGEKEEEHIGAEGEGWSLGREVVGGLEEFDSGVWIGGSESVHMLICPNTDTQI